LIRLHQQLVSMLKDWVYLLIDPLRRQFVSMLKDWDYLLIDPFASTVCEHAEG
jgi:hypothetical protein